MKTNANDAQGTIDRLKDAIEAIDASKFVREELMHAGLGAELLIEGLELHIHWLMRDIVIPYRVNLMKSIRRNPDRLKSNKVRHRAVMEPDFQLGKMVEVEEDD